MAADSPPKTVWILGAGFSAALGAPTLDQLLTRESKEGLDAHFTNWSVDHPDRASLIAAYELYERFGPRNDGAQNPRSWGNPEQFLEVLDLAHARGLEPKVLFSMAKRIVAAECSIFLQAADLDEERFEPFIEWGKGLAETDTLISFNYDLALETILPKRVQTVLPDSEPEPGVASLLKLHGSVDWTKIAGSFRAGGDRHWQTCDHDDLFMAVPGRSKKNLVTTELAPLWKLALERIGKAEIVVFLGYRFPPSDAQARQRILGAISANKSSYLRLHTVLGPNNPDQKRLEKLLEFAAERRKTSNPNLDYGVEVHPLLVQDFLSVFDRRILKE